MGWGEAGLGGVGVGVGLGEVGLGGVGVGVGWGDRKSQSIFVNPFFCFLVDLFLYLGRLVLFAREEACNTRKRYNINYFADETCHQQRCAVSAIHGKPQLVHG